MGGNLWRNTENKIQELHSLWQRYLTEYCLLHGFKVLFLKVRKTLEINVLKRFFYLSLQGMGNRKFRKPVLKGKMIGYCTCVLRQTLSEILKIFCLFSQLSWGIKDELFFLKACLIIKLIFILKTCCYAVCRLLIPCIAETPWYTRHGPSLHCGWCCWQEGNSSSL